VLTALLLAGTIPGIRAATSGTMEWIGLAKDGRGFEMVASGRPYVPWGFNYDRDYRMRLIEEFWADEWETVEQDFAEMKNLGANVVRVHLQLSAFMDSPTTANAANLDRLGRLLALAERTGLYLDLTGLACYRREKVPPWYDPLPEPARWAVQARFWEAVAGRCAASPAVFFYDLMNEPISPGPDCVAGDWLVGNLAGFW
jgi:aryl-phospho-beta-D-glucosidase BglC (GH1 family)